MQGTHISQTERMFPEPQKKAAVNAHKTRIFIETCFQREETKNARRRFNSTMQPKFEPEI